MEHDIEGSVRAAKAAPTANVYTRPQAYDLAEVNQVYDSDLKRLIRVYENAADDDVKVAVTDAVYTYL